VDAHLQARFGARLHVLKLRRYDVDLVLENEKGCRSILFQIILNFKINLLGRNGSLQFLPLHAVS
jgi:hypothetical protein